MMKYTTLLLAFLLVGIQSVLAQDCTNDTQSPTVACIDFLSVNLDDFEGLFTLYPQDILAGATDNCTDTLDFQISEGNTPNDPPSTTSLEFNTPGTYTPVLWAIDEAGNFSQCWMTLEIQGADPDCEEDTTAPNIICFTGQTVTLDENTGTVTVPAQFIIQSVWDDCTDTLSLTIGLDDALPEPPTATAYVFDAVGTYAVVVWAEDTAGNWSYCVSALTVEDDAPECDDDTEAPLVACLDVLSVELNPNGTIEIFGTDLLAAVTDNCSEDFDYFIGTTDGGNDLPATISLVYTDPGVYYPAVYVVDEAGNWNNCWTEVIVGGTNADCENDTEAPNIICFTGQEVLLSENTGTAIVPATFFIYNVFDNCTDSIAITMSLDEPLNSPPASTAETFDQAGTYAVYVAAEDEAGNWAYCATTVIVEGGISGAYAISGHVVRDLDDNCQVDSTDMPLQGWGVSLWTGDNYDIPVGQGLSAVTGLYEIQFSEPQGGFTDSIQVRIDVAANLPQGCPLYHNYAAQDLVAGVALNGDFTVTLVEDCPAMQVDLATPFLRRCFDSQYYIQYCNYGSETAVDAYIELELDDYLVYQSSTVSPAAIDGQVYTFDVGDVAPGECGSIGLVVYVDCNAVLGQTHCSQARIFPDTLCGPAYTGPVIEVVGNCDEGLGKVVFELTNTGQEAMLQEKNYLVVEDVIMYMQEPFILNSGESIEVELPATGATYTLEAEQPDSYPWLDVTSASVEGCSEDGSTGTSGIITQLGPLNPNPAVSVNCEQNIGAYDPNDKQAFPSGLGEDHLLPANRPLNYRIRFQNTGTDTAFTVVVRDTLSDYLSAESVQPGASSHDYTFRIVDGNVLEFRFDNILLPDSTTNLSASQGFLQFEVRQQPDLPDGTLLENKAAIYFDFNDPIITNTVFHTIGERSGTTSASSAAGELTPLRVYPNPFSTQSILQLPVPTNLGWVTVYKITGEVVLDQAFAGDTFLLNSAQLGGPGIYIYQVSTAEGGMYQGKVLTY